VLQKTMMIKNFLLEFKFLTSRVQAGKIKRLTDFLADFRECHRIELAKGNFDLLEVTGVGKREVIHSSILAWLLTPNAHHGHGIHFLKSFLKAAKIQIADEFLLDCHVRTEFSGIESIIDILICKPGRFVIYVENKTVSPEGNKQIDREYRDMNRLADSIQIPHDQRFPIFLTPDGRPPLSGNARPWRILSYNELAQEFLETLPDLRGRKIAFFIEDLIHQYERL